MFSGITGQVFHLPELSSGTSDLKVDGCVAVEVGAGVMGENIRGFCVAVGNGAEVSVGNACVGALTVGTAGAVAAAAFSPQAVVKTQIIKVKIDRRFIKPKYIGQKLSSDEFYATLAL